MTKKAVKEKITFEIGLQKLEKIVSELEQANVPLEQALNLYEEGIKLSQFCSSQLKTAERKVELLEEKDGELKSKPFLDLSETSSNSNSESDNELEDGLGLEEDQEFESEQSNEKSQEQLF